MKKWIIFSAGYLGVYSGLNTWLMSGGKNQLLDSPLSFLVYIALLPQVFLKGVFGWDPSSPINTVLQAPISLIWYLLIFFIVWKLIRLAFKAVGWIKWLVLLGIFFVFALHVVAGYLIYLSIAAAL